MTRLVGLMGWPVGHSLSPAIHNAAFEAMRLNWRYVPLPVAPENLQRALDGLAALGFAGANVTIPHKTAVASELDQIRQAAGAMGAVNTILVEQQADGGHHLVGDNTDALGFVNALERIGYQLRGERVVVAGAGGVARAVVYGALVAQAEHVLVLARDVRQATHLADDVNREGPDRIDVGTLDSTALVEACQTASLLVNATPVGMVPNHEASIWPGAVPMPRQLLVNDLVYAPLQTRLMEQAQASGASALGGLDMLIEQAAEAFSLWTGEEAPRDCMRVACARALERRTP